jgi:hypothetical protein
MIPKSFKGGLCKATFELSKKPTSPDDTVRILVNPFGRIADETNHLVSKILPTAEEVDNVTSKLTKSKSVDGQVPPRKIFFEGINEINRAILIANTSMTIGSKSSHLNIINKSYTEALTDKLNMAVGEEILKIVRAGVGDNILVLRGLAKKQIPNRTASDISSEAVRAKPLDDLFSSKVVEGDVLHSLIIPNYSKKVNKKKPEVLKEPPVWEKSTYFRLTGDSP